MKPMFDIQILAPHDSEICRLAYENMEPKSEYWDMSKLSVHPLLYSADPVVEKYFADELSLCRYKYVTYQTSC